MIAKPFRLSFRYRLLFYPGGFTFATTSYLAGIWAFGAESARWGDVEFYRRLMSNLVGMFQSHTLSFFVWQVICAGLSIGIGYLFDREVYYRRKAEQKANIDGLTDIYNHRYFQERLTAEIDRASRYDRPLSLIMLDLDDFKAYNDTWGHQEGDRLLKWFADVCGRCVRTIDVLARYGGEEFVIVLPETHETDALALAERIRKQVESGSAHAMGQDRRVTVSAGVAGFPHHGESRHALILSADAALYYAKQQGKNTSVVYHEQCNWSYRPSPSHVKALLCDDDLAAIEALGAAADARESHLQGHSKEVMRLSVALGQKMGLSAQELDGLRSAALLHDIGKISTPEEILGKQGPLVAEEWRQIEDHAGLGSRILRRVQQLGSVIPAVKHHHERYDGKGYPSGLQGKNIPVIARIICIADAFDAMTHDRPYRPAMPQADAIAELRRCAGAQFDPDLVEAFIAAVESQSGGVHRAA